MELRQSPCVKLLREVTHLVSIFPWWILKSSQSLTSSAHSVNACWGTTPSCPGLDLTRTEMQRVPCFSHKEAAVGPWSSQTQICRVAPGWQGPSGQRHEGPSEKPHYIQQWKSSLKLKHERNGKGLLLLAEEWKGKVTFTVHSAVGSNLGVLFIYIYKMLTSSL